MQHIAGVARYGNREALCVLECTPSWKSIKWILRLCGDTGMTGR